MIRISLFLMFFMVSAGILGCPPARSFDAGTEDRIRADGPGFTDTSTHEDTALPPDATGSTEARPPDVTAAADTQATDLSRRADTPADVDTGSAPDATELPDRPALDTATDPGCAVDSFNTFPELFVHVAVGGTDSSDCGAATAPCTTIKHGLTRLPAGGGQVAVHSGLFQENNIRPGDNTRLYAADGPLTARIHSQDNQAVVFDEVENAALEGFEVYADWNQGPDTGGLIRIVSNDDGGEVRRVAIRDCILHDAPADADVIKVSGQAHQILFDNLILYNPAQRTDGNFQENIDIFGRFSEYGEPVVSDVTLRSSWLFHTAQGGDWLVYAKSRDRMERIVYENNLFGPSAGLGWGNPTVGIGTNDISNADDWVIEGAIVRNNVFVGLHGDAALAIDNSANVWVYNNTFYANEVSRGLFEFYSSGLPSDHVFIFNNIFQDNQPLAFCRERTTGGLTTFEHDHNLYLDTTTDDCTSGEPNGLYDIQPGLTSPAIPSVSPIPTDLGAIVTRRAGFELQGGAGAIDEGRDVVAHPSHPAWDQRRCDIDGDPRPIGDTWDLGVDER